ncbi:MAG: hypothetical protein MI923_25265 [Phycisphaerales bacterium]|nr:hypothetical protein [Phycisphaerales bacterium]
MKKIELELARSVHKEKIKGIEFLVAISPYFFPEYLRYGYDKDNGVFIFQFKYLDDANEPRRKQSDNIVTLEIGQTTGRLLGIELQVDKHNVDNIKLRIVELASNAIERAEERIESRELRSSYDALKESLREHENTISEAL